jgi:Transglycosylase-like domain
MLLGVSLLAILSLTAGVGAAGVLTGEPDTRPFVAPTPDPGGWGRGDETGVPSALREIARCESGGDLDAVSADGVYRGKYQFDHATWAEVGGRGDPAAAPERVQDRLAARLYRQRGEAPWPVCSA